jgi:hypothetical protein
MISIHAKYFYLSLFIISLCRDLFKFDFRCRQVIMIYNDS